MSHFPAMPTRRDSSASRMWFGCARFKTVLLNKTINSSCSRLNSPVSGCSPVLVTTPSLTHCQNCVCVVQNCFRSRQITSAVFFLRFFFLFGFMQIHLWPCVTRAATHVPVREASLARQQQVLKPADEHSLLESGNASGFDGCLTQRLMEVSGWNWLF